MLVPRPRSTHANSGAGEGKSLVPFALNVPATGYSDRAVSFVLRPRFATDRLLTAFIITKESLPALWSHFTGSRLSCKSSHQIRFGSKLKTIS
jgi:hypothetical protein